MDFILTNHIKDYKSAKKMVNVKSATFSIKLYKFDVDVYVSSDDIDTGIRQAHIQTFSWWHRDMEMFYPIAGLFVKGIHG